MNDNFPRVGDTRWFFLAATGLVAGAIYVVLVATIALVLGKPRPAEIAAATEGLVYLNCMAFTMRFNLAGSILGALATACGIIAGIDLLW